LVELRICFLWGVQVQIVSEFYSLRFLLVAGELIKLVVNHDASVLVVKVKNISNEVLIFLSLQEVMIDQNFIVNHFVVERTVFWRNYLALDA